jgi:preprotein translocase subunit YajC
MIKFIIVIILICAMWFFTIRSLIKGSKEHKRINKLVKDIREGVPYNVTDKKQF